jgi:hypothetical protein
MKYGGVYIPNLANDGKYGIGQYRFPRNYELNGKSFTIEADGKTYDLAFTCRERAQLDGKACDYESLKLEKDTYFVRLGQDIAVINVEQCLATLILGDTFVYGAFKGPDGKLPAARHARAGDDMTDTKIRWVLGPNKYVNQEYIGGAKVRTAWSKNTVMIGNGMKSFRDNWEAAAEDYDDLPYTAVKITEPMYLVEIKGGVREGVCAPKGTNRIVTLQDYERMMLVGCVFGEGFEPVMITGYAKFLD